MINYACHECRSSGHNGLVMSAMSAGVVVHICQSLLVELRIKAPGLGFLSYEQRELDWVNGYKTVIGTTLV